MSDAPKAMTPESLVQAHANREGFRSFASLSGIADVASAYAFQVDFVRLLSAAGKGEPVGYKIGLTSPRMQAMCGIDTPIAGVVLGGGVLHSGARVEAMRFGRLGIECEVAIRLGEDFKPEGNGFAGLEAAIDGIAVAFELVDDRRADYAALDVLSLIADNSWNAGVVLGAFRKTWPDLAIARGTVFCNGAEVDNGLARDVLGHPYNSVLWLARHLVHQGKMLRRGDIVMTGSLVPTRMANSGETYRFAIDGLGAVEVAIS